VPGIKHPIDGVVYFDPEEARAYFETGGWVDSTVGDALRSTAASHPDKLAFVSDERQLTFRELDDLTDRLGAALLDMGLGPADRVLFQVGTNVETALALLACYKVGVVPVCSLPQHREIEIEQLANHSQARGHIVQQDFSTFDLVGFAQRMQARCDSIEHLLISRGSGVDGVPTLGGLIDAMDLDAARERLATIEIGSEDVLKFQLSGGTTGTPKIIPRFHAEYLEHTAGWMRRFGIEGPDASATVIYNLPLIHNAGQLFALVSVVSLGVTAVLMPKPDIPRMLELIEEHAVTHALSIGPVAPQLLAYQDVAKHDLSSLRLFVTMSRADTLEQHIGVPCSNLFGITEGLVMTSPPGAPVFVRHQTQGRSGVDQDEIRLLEPDSDQRVAPGEMGELCFRGPSSLRGYFAAPEANATAFTSDGFYRSGDMMTAHEVDGHTYYRFEGRSRDNINRGGEKIGCEEVEAFVSMHPAVADAKLVAMPDPVYGEKGCAFITLRPGHEPPDVEQLMEFLTGMGLAKYKCPERIKIVDAFPVTRVGKVDKPAMRAQIAEELQNEQAHATDSGARS